MQEILDNAQLFNRIDTSSQCDENRQLEKRPPWKTEHINKFAISPQSSLIVTHVNQTLDLQRANQYSAIPSKGQTSEEWLQNHDLEHQKLTLKDLLQKGKQVKKKGEGKHLMFDAMAIAEMEYKLNVSIETYHKRVKWLLEGSKKLFGLIKGERVGVLIDSSDANTGFGRLEEFQQSLLYLIDEQLKHKKSLYFLSFGTDYENLWNHARDVNNRILEEARDFVRGLHPSGGCNLLKALKKIFKVKKLNSIVIVLGNCPDQTATMLYDYVQQMLLGRHLPIQAIAYDTSNNMTHSTLQRLAEHSHGRYHCYNSSDDREVYKSFDIQMLLREAQRAVDVISKIKQMKTGMLGDALISIESEIALEVSRLSDSRFLPRPPNHFRPLSIETPNFHPLTSQQWLAENGLQAKNLIVYQILAPNAFDPVHDFIPILGKSVGSKIHEQAMHQFEWHDGSVKNVHVDVAMIYEYQTQLGAEVKNLERRIEWLSSASRGIWGTICEKRVVLMIDTSVTNKQYVVHLQHSVRVVLEQQLANKQAFNIIAFGSHPKMWKPQMVRPSPEALQAAWRWTLDLSASGSRNLMSAFRAAVENDEDVKKWSGVEGIYLLTSGVPDQEEDVICSFVSETCTGSDVKLHTILFNIDTEYDAPDDELPSRYATVDESADCLRNLAHAGNGRFHWFSESGITESDDVYALTREMDRAVAYSHRCSSLVQGVKSRDEERREAKQLMLCDGSADNKKKKTEIVRPLQAIEPRPTALTLARLSLREPANNNSKQSSQWKVSKRKPGLPEAPYKPGAGRGEDAKTRRRTTTGKLQQEPFYTERRNAVGVVYKSYPKQRSVRKQVPEPVFPQLEERITSRQWLRKYGLNKIKLNLHKYVSGPVCRHDKSTVSTCHDDVTAKWFCSIFPSAVIEGAIRHIDMKPAELEHYEQQVTNTIARYSKRMQWLLSGSRRVFGTIVENQVVILIDISGSMVDSMDELKQEMTSLIWEQLRESGIAFNLIAFSNSTATWQDHVTSPDDESCDDAVQWTSTLQAHGGTATLDALQLAFADEGAQAVYLLTDGKPDTSAKLTLQRVDELNVRKLPVHCVSFKCDNAGANEFLQRLSAATGGRYHRVQAGVDDAQFAAYRLQQEGGCQDHDDPNLPDFTGDDLRAIKAEINKARKFLTLSRDIRKVIGEHGASSKREGGEPTTDTKRVSNRPFYP